MVVPNIFYVHPYLGKIPILTNVFQMGGSTTNQSWLPQFLYIRWNPTVIGIIKANSVKHHQHTSMMGLNSLLQTGCLFFLILKSADGNPAATWDVWKPARSWEIYHTIPTFTGVCPYQGTFSMYQMVRFFGTNIDFPEGNPCRWSEFYFGNYTLPRYIFCLLNMCRKRENPLNSCYFWVEAGSWHGQTGIIIFLGVPKSFLFNWRSMSHVLCIFVDSYHEEAEDMIKHISTNQHWFVWENRWRPAANWAMAGSSGTSKRSSGRSQGIGMDWISTPWMIMILLNLQYI